MSGNFTIKCGPKQMKLIEDHCFSETEVEVGGFLVGLIGTNETLVSNVFPAQHSVGASTQLTFTHESWNALYEQLKSEPEGTTLVGWYHSHPNFGVFLSEHDKFIQSNFFKQDGNVTIVVDPIRGRKGWFYSEKGKIEKYKQEMNTDRPRLGRSATDPDANIGQKLSSGVPMKHVIAISATMSLLSFVLSWATTSMTTGGGSATQASVSALTARVQDLNNKLDQLSISSQQIPVKPKVESKPKVANSPTPKSSSRSISPSAKASSSSKPATSATKNSSTKTSSSGAELNKPCATVGEIDTVKNLRCTETTDSKGMKTRTWKPAGQVLSGTTGSGAKDETPTPTPT